MADTAKWQVETRPWNEGEPDVAAPYGYVPHGPWEPRSLGTCHDWYDFESGQRGPKLVRDWRRLLIRVTGHQGR